MNRGKLVGILGLAVIISGIGFFAVGCKEKVRHHHPEPEPPRPHPGPSWCEITGRLLVDGKPAEKGKVTVFWGKARANKQTCSVDKKGYFAIRDIPAKREIAVELRGKRHKREYATTRSLYSGRSGEVISLGVIDLAECKPQPGPRPRPVPRPAPCPQPGPAPCPKPKPVPSPHHGPDKFDLKISGRVMYEGKPLEGVVVRVMSGKIYDRFVNTDKKGRFRVTDVPRRAKVDIFAEMKIHKGKLVGSAVVHTDKDNINVGEIILFKKKK